MNSMSSFVRYAVGADLGGLSSVLVSKMLARRNCKWMTFAHRKRARNGFHPWALGSPPNPLEGHDCPDHRATPGRGPPKDALLCDGRRLGHGTLRGEGMTRILLGTSQAKAQLIPSGRILRATPETQDDALGRLIFHFFERHACTSLPFAKG